MQSEKSEFRFFQVQNLDAIPRHWRTCGAKERDQTFVTDKRPGGSYLQPGYNLVRFWRVGAFTLFSHALKKKEKKLKKKN